MLTIPFNHKNELYVPTYVPRKHPEADLLECAKEYSLKQNYVHTYIHTYIHRNSFLSAFFFALKFSCKVRVVLRFRILNKNRLRQDQVCSADMSGMWVSL
jgi:hypothetical protein